MFAATRPDIEPDAAAETFRQLHTPDVSGGGVNLVLGFGAQMWRRLAGVTVPEELEPFQPIAGADGHGAPATQHDAWLWIAGPSRT
jgi:porphyrinogen peroxidase